MNKLILALLLLIISIVSFLSRTEEAMHNWSSTIADVFQTMSTESYFPVSIKPALIKALDAYVHQVDEHSQFLGPDDYQELLHTTSGTFFGIGIELGQKKEDDDFLMIIGVKAESPAEKAGIKRYDKIVAIDGAVVEQLTIHEAINKLKGNKRFSEVVLSILRDKVGPLTITIKRDLIQEDNCWCCHLTNHNILYCSVSQFSKQTAHQLETALLKGLQKKPRGIILDLRDNAGGVFQAAVDCGALFLPRGSLVVSAKDRSGKVIEQLHTERDPLVKGTTPLIIVVNTYTASSAEIVAQALKIHAKKSHAHAYIVGTKTYGKGSVQEVKPIGKGCALKITTALYYLPDNTSIHDKGIIPDFIIKQKYPPSNEMKLVQKLHEKERIKKRKKTVSKDTYNESQARLISLLKKDYQVQCACNLILLLDLAQKSCPKEVNSHEKALSWLHKHFSLPQTLEPMIL